MNDGNLAYGLHCATEKYFDRADLQLIKGAGSIETILKTHGLDYQVIMVPHVNAFTGQPTTFFDTYRDDTKEILGAGLTERYHIIQNADNMAVIEDIAALYDGDVYFARGMTFDGGRVAVAQIDLGEMIIGEGRNGFKDKVRKYLTWTNAHDGSGAQHYFLSPTRIVCANTLTAALSATYKKGGKREDKITKFSIRHTATAKERMDAARSSLKVINGELTRTEHTYQVMAYTKMTTDQKREVFAQLFPTEDKDKRAANIAKEAASRAADLIRNADDGRIDPDSAWGFYQGLTRYYDHESPIRLHGEKSGQVAQSIARTQSTLTGTIAEKNAKALSTLINVTEIHADITRLLERVETSQAAQLALYAPQEAAPASAAQLGFSLYDMEVGS
jgi:phage/plasmid-like protein (TIGR03299 family)